MSKPTAKIHNYEVVRDPHTKEPTVLIGTITDHPNQSQFKTSRQVTSRIKTYDFVKGIVETLNTRYLLQNPAGSE